MTSLFGITIAHPARAGSRLRGNAAPIVLAVIACLAAACGSSSSTTTRAAVPAHRERSAAPAHRGTVGLTASHATSTPANHSRTTAPGHPTPVHPRKKTEGAPTAASVRARQAAAVAQAEKTCGSRSAARRSLACQLLAQARHNKALAALLGATGRTP
jgi:hypothetical protein